ncbi:putative transporter protein [Halomicronema hongdechloris C2206]|uniref:Transporter protein n=1 Tax=Halomicronema hongdechloris C2206 TaxID=1641165 RepID=A0A1Z3HG78_9CYAN|nr:MFS transporter [Halomicronema hongdechloris]ASC69266.1 putative transporter protein [Halomicronema hongdechloris C2206]
MVHGWMRRFRDWLPDLDQRVWILAGGRLLSQVGIGFTLFYAPIFFVDRVGLTATQVGLGIGSGSLSGMIARFLGGSMADSPRWGRRFTLLLSALVSAAADGILVATHNFPTFILGNLLMGFGIGLYWPATEAMVGGGLSENAISWLFTGHVALAALCQLSIARALKPLPLPRALMISACLWGLSFCLTWQAGIAATGALGWALMALGVMALAMAAYTPIASSLVAVLAPEALRGVYLSINSMCWAIGYFMGPPLGGWALDQSRAIANSFWLALALSVALGLGGLRLLDQRLDRAATEHSS